MIDKQKKRIFYIESLQLYSDNLIQQLFLKKESEHNNYIKVLRNLENVKQDLDRTNHINGLLVQSIKSGIDGELPQVSQPSSNPNGISTAYKASDVAAGITDVGFQCNKIRNNYIALQTWIEEVQKID